MKVCKVERKYNGKVSNNIVKTSNRFNLLTEDEEDDVSEVVKKVGENKLMEKVAKELEIKEKLYNIKVITI